MSLFTRLFTKSVRTLFAPKPHRAALPRRSLLGQWLGDRRIELLEERACPAVWTVNVLTDAAPGAMGVGILLTGDFRYCVDHAGNNDQIWFANNLTGTLTLNASVSVNASVSIYGWNTNVIITGANDITPLGIGVGESVTLADLNFANSTVGSNGGAIYNEGTLAVKGCDFYNNTAANGGAIYNEVFSGCTIGSADPVTNPTDPVQPATNPTNSGAPVPTPTPIQMPAIGSTSTGSSPVLAVTETDNVGDTVNLQVSAAAPNGDPLSYSAIGLPDGLAINATTGVISGTVASDAAGSFYSVAIVATDTITGQMTVQDIIWTINTLATTVPTVNAPNGGAPVASTFRGNNAVGVKDGDFPSAGDGGAIYCSLESNLNVLQYQSGQVTCFYSNTANGAGGAIALNSATATIASSFFTENSASEGGGIFLEDAATATLLANLIDYNWASDAGGGICVEWGNLTFTNQGSQNTFLANKAFAGGAICFEQGTLTIGPNLAMSDDIALPGMGSGIYIQLLGGMATCTTLANIGQTNDQIDWY